MDLRFGRKRQEKGAGVEKAVFFFRIQKGGGFTGGIEDCTLKMGDLVDEVRTSDVLLLETTRVPPFFAMKSVVFI